MSDVEHEHHAGFGDCRGCRQMWMDRAGIGGPGTCMLCSGRHWPWDPHNGAGPAAVGYPPPADPSVEEFLSDVAGTVMPDRCEFCRERFGDDDQILPMIVVGTGAEEPRAAWGHKECQALGIVGHDFGVCSCTGFGKDRAAALELWRRIQEANRAGAGS